MTLANDPLESLKTALRGQPWNFYFTFDDNVTFIKQTFYFVLPKLCYCEGGSRVTCWHLEKKQYSTKLKVHLPSLEFVTTEKEESAPPPYMTEVGVTAAITTSMEMPWWVDNRGSADIYLHPLNPQSILEGGACVKYRQCSIGPSLWDGLGCLEVYWLHYILIGMSCRYEYGIVIGVL